MATPRDRRTRRPGQLPPTMSRVSPEIIAHRAYELFLLRGSQHGRDMDDWLQAERELALAPRPTAES
jgi:hypothetical protein